LRGAVGDATKAGYDELFAIEDQAKALRNLADEQRKAAEAAERLANLTATVEEDFLRATGRGFNADVKALERRRDDRIDEARKAGASEDTITQIRAIFEANMQTLIARTIDAATPTSSGASGARGGEFAALTESVSRSISQLEAIRLIDIAGAQLDALRQIVNNTGGGGGGGTVTVDVNVTGAPGAASDLGASIGSALVPALDLALGRRVGIERRLTGNASL